MTDARPLPGDESPIGTTLPGVAHVPPAWFLTTSTAFSAHRLAGLLHPAAGPGVRRVSGRSPPRDGRTLRRVPLVDSRATSPWPCASLPLPARCRSPWPKPWAIRGRSPRIIRSKLRSAEADPHVDLHARGASTRATAEVEARTEVRAATTTNEPPGRARHVAPPNHRRARSPKRPGCPVRRRERRRTCGRTGELVETSREAADFEALLRRRVRCVTPPLPAKRRSILPWVLSPPRSPTNRSRTALPRRAGIPHQVRRPKPKPRRRPESLSGSRVEPPVAARGGPVDPTFMGFLTSMIAPRSGSSVGPDRSEEHTSELQSQR